jgi:hypothetical protein
MHGRIISGIGYSDPETLRLETELLRIQRSSPTAPFLKSNYQRDLEKTLETRKRINAKRESLRATSRTPADALDVLNARAEAEDLADRMKAAGYTDSQIQATVRPMLVNPAATITGRAERRAARKKRREERKAAGKGIFRKIGAAIKKGAGTIFKGAAKLNPLLVGARAAVLSLVSKNTLGLADKFRSAGVDKARKKWEALGGDFAKLQEAVQKGSGQRITGLDDYYDLPESMQPGMVIGVAPLAVGGMAKLWAIAKPVVEKLLGVLGVKLDKPLEEALATPDDAEAKAIREQADDAEDPNTGDGEGSNGGGKPISPLLLAGIAAAVIFAVSKK